MDVLNILKKRDDVKIISIITYVFIAIFFRYIFTVTKPVIIIKFVEDGLLYDILTGIGPFLSVIIVSIIFKRKLLYSNFGTSKFKTVISILVPLLLFFLYDYFGVSVNYTNFLIVIACIIYSFFEEYGWRGYLQSELIGLSCFVRISLITIIWFIWHLNFSLSLSNMFFLLVLFFASWGIGKIAIKTQSIIVCACFHAVYNIALNIELNIHTLSILLICIVSWFIIWYKLQI